MYEARARRAMPDEASLLRRTVPQHQWRCVRLRVFRHKTPRTAAQDDAQLPPASGSLLHRAGTAVLRPRVAHVALRNERGRFNTCTSAATTRRGTLTLTKIAVNNLFRSADALVDDQCHLLNMSVRDVQTKRM